MHDTTQLFDVTFLLRNIIVTLKVRQKPPRNDCTDPKKLDN